jgi:hypothetical protein
MRANNRGSAKEAQKASTREYTQHSTNTFAFLGSKWHKKGITVIKLNYLCSPFSILLSGFEFFTIFLSGPFCAAATRKWSTHNARCQEISFWEYCVCCWMLNERKNRSLLGDFPAR